MNIKISADSTCDLSPELVERYRIGIAPLYIVRDGESLVDGVDITPDEIYDHVAKGGSMCSTAAVSVYDYEEFFRKELESADAVVHFHISGDMSACYQNACIAAAEVGNVYPVDARNLSTGIGLLVLEAAELAQNGQLTAQEIQQRMEQRRELLDVSFLVEQLGYLRKGGRCSSVAALGAYSILWQQVLKRMPLNFAYSNKGVCTLWTCLFGILFFGESLTLGKAAGILVVLLGVWLVVTDHA